MSQNKKLKNSSNANTVNPNFKTIANLEYKKYNTLVGVVLNILEPMQSRGTDFVTTLTVQDEEIHFIDVKIFTPTPIYANFFKRFDIIRIPYIKLIKPGVGITGRGSQIEVLQNIHHDDSPKVFVTESEKIKIEALKKCYIKNVQAFSTAPLMKIDQIKPQSTFSLNALLISIHAECPIMTTLTMVDFTKNPCIQPVIQNMAFTNNMTLLIRVWGEKNATEVRKLSVDKIYHISKIKTDQLGMLLESKISESFYSPFKELSPEDSIYKEIKEAQKKYFQTVGKPTQKSHKKLPEKFQKYNLSDIENIDENGVYRICAKIVFNFPNKPDTVYICDNCKSIESDQFKVTNKKVCQMLKKCNRFSEKLIKVQFEDLSGDLYAVFKNELAEKFAENINFFRTNELDALILHKNNFNFVLDADFDIIEYKY